MSRRITQNDFDNFDEWDNFDDGNPFEQSGNAFGDYEDDWEDDGAIAQVREEQPVISHVKEQEIEEMIEKDSIELDESSAQVVSLLGQSKSRRSKALLELVGPSEDELSRIEDVGIDEYIDIVLAQEDDSISAVKIEDTIQDVQEQDIIQDDQEDQPVITPRTITVVDEDYSEDQELVVRPLFEGLAVSLPTLFDEDENVEYSTTARLAKKMDSNNISAIFVATRDGEGATLTIAERIELVKQVRKSTKNIVVADITSPSIKQSRELAIELSQYVDAFVITIDTNTNDPYRLCEEIHEANRDIALFVQLVGNPEDLIISPEFLYDLPIQGVIDSTGDAGFFIHLTSAYSGPLYVGSSSMVTFGHHMGAAGVVLPHIALHQDLVEQAFSGDITSQQELLMWEIETGNSSTRAIKLALENTSLTSSTMRD